MPKKQQHRRDGIYERKDRPGFWGSYVDASGRRKQRKLPAPTLTQAREELHSIKKAVAYQLEHGVPQPTKETFADFATLFLGYQKRRISTRVLRGKLSEAEYNRQSGIMAKHLIPFFGKMKLGTIKRRDVIAYINSRTGQVGDGTVIKEVNTLKRMFSVAIDSDKLAVNPAHRAPVPKAPEGRVRYLSTEEMGNILRSCPEWLRPIVGLLVSTGARRGELLKVRWEDINISRGEIRLRHTKSGKERIAYINELVEQVLGAMAEDATKAKGLLFPGVTPAQVTVAFSRACKDAKVEDFKLHDLRHHFSSMLRQNGVDLHTLQKLLGHSDPRMTDRYAHLSQQFLMDAAKRLDAVLSLQPAPAETIAITTANSGSIVTIALPAHTRKVASK
jgi:integrase